jgi:hypothetical protein
MKRLLMVTWVAVGLVAVGFAGSSRACPFCAAVSQTFSQEMETMDVVVIARLTKLPPPVDPNAPSDFGADLSKAQFTISEVLKGERLVQAKQPIETLYFGEGSLGKEFLIMAVRETLESSKLQWTTPLLLSERGKTYIHKLPSLPKEGADRLAFFQDYLEDKDESLARDAYDEFANASYEAVKELKDRMDHTQLVAWIKNDDIPASRRRLYLTMLGVCGGEADVPMLEEMLRSSDRKAKAGLDAMIGCYLTLTGEAGVPLIEELYLANPEAEYADTYSAIMAMRFHGTEGGVIPKERVVKAVRHMLDRPQLADLVIPDLARWQDWESMDQMVKLFKTADEKSSWVRVPVINFLRACPLPEAKKHLVELEKIDPAAVKRANTFFPGPTGNPGGDNTSRVEPPSAGDGLIAVTPPAAHARAAAVVDVAADGVATETPAVPNLWTVLSVPWVIGLTLLVCQYGILRGVGR